MQRPDSDVDIRSVTVSPLHTMLDPFSEEKIRTHKTDEGDDHVIYELRSFLRLLGKGSPSVIDVVYSPITEAYGELGHDLLIHRRKFIDAETALNNCIGYCRGMYANSIKGERPIKSLRSAVLTTDVVLSYLRGHAYNPMKWDTRRDLKEITGSEHEQTICADMLWMGVNALESERSKLNNEFDIKHVRDFCVRAYQTA